LAFIALVYFHDASMDWIEMYKESYNLLLFLGGSTNSMKLYILNNSLNFSILIHFS